MPANTCKVIALSIALPLVAYAISRRSQSLVVADEPAAVVWKQTRSFPAPEAHQAAAADAKFFYAISNDKIAKYDRQTGERVAVSSGVAARHLNSGFFHEGQLYCAHSNYPRQPEQSEIMRLDPQSMELKVFKDFGNFGGSLTWAFHLKGDWWCNFARYGAENDKTFLVRFNEEWQEKQRWTYPAEVIRQIGTASISGGIWEGDRLLVTDHDHRVLYRLQLPAEGSVLELIRKEQAPFTGQGIAHDPATAGLVGIDRGKKEVLFAELEK